jgi:TPR repeat protein
VTATQPHERPALLDEREEVQNCQADWVGVIAGAAFMGAIINPILIPLAPALASVFVISLKHQENAINHILDDPPRLDYATETRARSRRYFAGRFGDSDLALATDAAVISTLRVVAYLEASVRADERAQGARLAGDDGSTRLRSEEALIFRERARAADADRAVWLDTLSLAWASEWATTPGAPEAVPQGPPQVNVRSEIHSAARIAGMVTSRLTLPQTEQTQPERSPRVIWEAVEATRRLARSAETFFRGAPTPLAENFVTRRREPALPETLQQGLVFREQGDLESAETQFRQAANAGSTDAMFELGSIAMQRENLPDAQDWFQRAMELTRAELRGPVHRVMKLKVEPSLEFEERRWLRRELPEASEED